MKRYGLLGALAALLLTACGNGDIKSPDFEPELKKIVISIVSGNPDDDTTLGAGETLQFKAVGTFTTQPGSAQPTEDHEITNVVWHSDKTDAVNINASGLATGGTLAGSVQITASKGDVTSAPIALNSLGAALREVVVTPASRTIAQNSTQEFTALGLYYGSDTPQPLNGTVTWSTDTPAGDPVIATVSPTEGATTIASSNDNLGQTHIVATNNGMSGQALLTVAKFRLQSLAISPATASVPLGDAQQFIAVATLTIDNPDSGEAPLPQSVDADWTIDDPSIASIEELPATSCVPATGPCLAARTNKRGTTALHASYTHDGVTKTADATLTVTDPVLKSLIVTPDTASAPVGTTQAFKAQGVYSDTHGDAIDIREGDAITWTSSNRGIATVAADEAGSAHAEATAVAVGTAQIKATSGALSDEATLTVTPAVVESLVDIDPRAATITEKRSIEFRAIGKFSDGIEKPLADSAVTWSSADAATATVDANGVATGVAIGKTKITATLKGTTSSKSADLTVTDEVCSTPLLKSDGASADGATYGACLLCGVTNPDNAIDNDLATFAGVNVAVGLADGSAGLTVTADPEPPVAYTVPFAAGSKPGFIISRPNGPLVLAELLSQISVETLLNGAQQEASGSLVPLRLDLLGIPLTGNEEEGLVTITTSLPYDAIRLRLKSGAASALTDVRVFQACATTLPPVPPVPLTKIVNVVSNTDTIEVGSAVKFTAVGLYEDDVQRDIQDADIVWTSSDPSVVSIDANGLATGLAESTAPVTITATLKPDVEPEVTGAARSHAARLNVKSAVCTTPFEAADGATVATSTAGLCILCGVSDRSNVIDGHSQTYGTIRVSAGLLGAAESITVSADPEAADLPADTTTGFLVGRPAGSLVAAELLSQVTVSTLRDGTVQDSSSGVVPLRLDLLGVELTTNSDVALVSIKSSQPYDSIRLTFNSGVASLLANLQVYSACAVATPPPAAP